MFWRSDDDDDDDDDKVALDLQRLLETIRG